MTGSHLVSRADLWQWIAASETTPPAPDVVDFAPDLSGNNRAVACSSFYPQHRRDERSGQFVFRFTGGMNPLAFVTSGASVIKHLFVFAKYSSATFSALNGLISDTNAVALLVGNPGTTQFYDLGYGVQQNYRKNDLLFANSNMQAAMNKFAVYELIFPNSIAIQGLQVGRDRQYGDRNWVGDIGEWIVYGAVKNDCERADIYRYAAQKFWTWRETADGHSIYPFPLDRASEHTEEELAETSEAEGGRGRDRVVRYLSDEPIDRWNAQFGNRKQPELSAWRAFLREHRLHLPFYLEDKERNLSRLSVWDGRSQDKGEGFQKFSYSFGVKDY